MDRPSLDFASARQLMVDGQVRPNKVYDARIIAAMRELPREAFLPEAQAALAYSDTAVPLGNGRAMLAPMAIARLVQAAMVQKGERALVIGAGAGYGASLLAACGAHVTALEDDAALIALARRVISHESGIKLVEGPLAEGWAKTAPYDVVLIEGAVDEVPEAIAAQVRAPSGRLVAIRTRNGRIGQAVVAEPAAGGLSYQAVFDCNAPAIPALRSAPSFVF